MNELIQPSRKTNRSLLAAASIVALSFAAAAQAAEGDHPTLWIELSGQADRLDFSPDRISAPFMSAHADSAVFQPVSPLAIQRPPRYAVGGGVKIEITPEDSDWVFSASLRYGRANSTRNAHKEKVLYEKNFLHTFNPTYYPSLTRPVSDRDVGDLHSTARQSYTVLDFSAGKDVGLGLFGRHSASVLNVGVRYAQFSARSTADLWARPDVGISYQYFPLGTDFGISVPLPHFHEFDAAGNAIRNFHGVGPSVAWSASVPLMGDPSRATLAVDFGINGALLFGRQKVQSAHHTSGKFVSKTVGGYSGLVSPYDNPHRRTQSRSVTVPNLGAFAGISYRFPSAKLSAGYRLDHFFGAMDGGLDRHRSMDIDFHGPFASVSVGL